MRRRSRDSSFKASLPNWQQSLSTGLETNLYAILTVDVDQFATVPDQTQLLLHEYDTMYIYVSIYIYMSEFTELAKSRFFRLRC